MLTEHEINAQGDFIQGWLTDDLNLCDDLTVYHGQQQRQRGLIGGCVRPDIKLSWDCHLRDPDLQQRYDQLLAQCCDLYTQRFPWSNGYNPWTVTSDINIQRYDPGEGFTAWHTERTGVIMPMATRHLVFMTYLNTVVDGGETEFFHQQLKIKPQQGLTLIWPADWTWTHRGLPSPTETKWVITGWFNYVSGA